MLKYRAEIDGLRALAIISVILFHAGFEKFSGGFVGVDIFFVISGYLITTIILAELEQKNFSLVDFYERRARRILPALFLVMFFCIPFAWFWLWPSELVSFSKSLIAVSVFVSNILFWAESGYFGVSSELIPLIHTWSLSVEEQYYVLFPLFMIFCWKLGKRWLFFLLIIVFIMSFALAQWASIAKPTSAFYLLPTRGWELLIGAFAAFFLSKANHTSFSRGAGECGGLLGLLLILFPVFTYTSRTPFPGFYTLVPTVGALFIILFATPKTSVGKFIGNKIFVGIGLISYSAYLWHQPLFAYAKIYTFHQVGFLLNICLILVTFILAMISFKYIETPFRNKDQFSRKSIFALSAFGIILFILMGWYGYSKDGFPKRFPQDIAVLTTAINDWPYPGTLHKEKVKGFYKFDKNKPVDVLFFGDSHVEQFAPLAVEIAKNGKNTGFLSSAGCPPIPNVFEDLHPECFDLFKRLSHILSIEKNIQTIVIGGCFNCYLTNQHSFNSVVRQLYHYYFLKNKEKLYLPSNEAHAEALKSFDGFLNRISKLAKIIVIGDNPVHISFDPSVRINYKLKGNSDNFRLRYPGFSPNEFMVYDDQIELNKKIMQLIPEEVTFINSMQIVCQDEKCKSLNNKGESLYKDNNHMRPHFIKSAFGKIIIDSINKVD